MKYLFNFLSFFIFFQFDVHSQSGSLSQKKNFLSDSDNIVLDASDFVGRINKDHYITDALTMDVPWLFNNLGLVLGTRSNYTLRTPIEKDGLYYLYVRSQGKKNSSFRIAINDKVISDDLGNTDLTFKKAGQYNLKQGMADVRIMRIENAPVFDVMILSTNPELTQSDIKSLQFDNPEQVLKEYNLPELVSAVRFGDVNGDKKMDFVAITDNYSAYMYDHSGKLLWIYEYPGDTEKDEAPGVIWDLNQDGKSEIIHWRVIDGKEWLVAADGMTGKVIKKTLWPTQAPLPHHFYNHRIAIAKFQKNEYPSNIIVYTDIGGDVSIANYDKELNLIWKNVKHRKKDNQGHYVYPRDINNDGIDEVAGGSLMLDSKGNELWNRFDTFYDNHDHVDAYSFTDLNGDGQIDLVAAHSEVGVMAIDALTGKMIWQNMAEHAQRVATGNFLKNVPGPNIAITARTYGNRDCGEPYLWGQVWYFDKNGEKISQWPENNPITGNPAFVQGDWDGDGNEELFWSKFQMNESGNGELYFSEPVYHMFNFEGNGAEEVITLDRHHGIMKVYGDKNPKDTKKTTLTIDYLRNHIVNHTYY